MTENWRYGSKQDSLAMTRHPELQLSDVHLMNYSQQRKARKRTERGEK